jgi:phage host-nuclease inhibitor protein Gam
VTTIDDPDDIADVADSVVPESDEDRADYVVADESVLWVVLRRLRAVERKRTALEARVQAEVNRLEAWHAERDAPLLNDAQGLRRLAEEYAVAERTRTHGRVKSVATPYGVVKTRESGCGWQVADEDALMTWAWANRTDLVKTVQTFALADAKRVLKDDGGTVVDPKSGEIVPGLKVPSKTLIASVHLAVDEPAP